MGTLHLKIVTPEKEIFDEEVDMVSLPTSQGEIGILPHHANLMSKIIPGELKIKNGSKNEVMVVGGGIIQMANNHLVVATDLAENVEEIDEKAAQQAKERAQAAMEQTKTEEEYALAAAALEKALAQLKVKRKHKVR